MGNILVIAFDNPTEAAQVGKTITELRKAKVVHLEDMRVVVKDAQGNLQVKDEAGMPLGAMVVMGGVLGAVLFITFPILGAAVGAGIAAGMTKWTETNLDKKFVNEVAAELQPNTSELFLLGTALDVDALLSALKPYKGTIIQTTVSSDNEALLKQALSERDLESPPTAAGD